MSEEKTGLLRTVDFLGKTVIPKMVREAVGILEGDKVEFFVDRETKV